MTVDMGVNTSVFAFDRGGRHHIAANEHVLRLKRLNPIDKAIVTEDFIDYNNLNCGSQRSGSDKSKENKNDGIDNYRSDTALYGQHSKTIAKSRETNETNENNENPPNLPNQINLSHPPNPPDLVMRYTVKVLAYNRPVSLGRLLASLLRADYLGQNVSMDILIDGNRTEEVLLLSVIFIVWKSFFIVLLCVTHPLSSLLLHLSPRIPPRLMTSLA